MGLIMGILILVVVVLLCDVIIVRVAKPAKPC